MSKLKEQILDELYKNNYRDLYNAVDKLESDMDVINYLSANRTYFDKTLGTKNLEGMPTFRKTMYEDLKTGKVDYDKEFGKDWYKNFENIPGDQIRFVAEKQGVDWHDLLERMASDATAKRREDIAHGRWDPNDPVYKNIANELGGVALNLFGSRQQEAIERGEEPGAKDYALDIVQTGLEAAPWGQAMRIINNPVARTLIGGAVSNATAPFATEALDAALYGEDTPRGQFNLGEAAAGTGVNVMGAGILKGVLGGGLSKLGARDAGQTIMHLGEGKTPGQARQELVDEVIAKGNKLRNLEHLSKQDFDNLNIADKAALLDKAAIETETKKGQILAKLAYKYNPKAVKKGLNKEQIKYLDGILGAPLTDNEIKLIKSDPELSKYLNIDLNFPELPTVGKLAGQEAIKNLITNKLGTVTNEQGKAFTRIPLAGVVIQKYIDEQEEEKKRKAEEEAILNELRVRGMLHLDR